jgi:hypothetical protein
MLRSHHRVLLTWLLQYSSSVSRLFSYYSEVVVVLAEYQLIVLRFRAFCIISTYT